MKIAVYGKTFSEGFRPYIRVLLNNLFENNVGISVYKPFCDYLCTETGVNRSFHSYFEETGDLDDSYDLMVSIGGDGTFLESIPFVVKNNIPVIGINSGRLGFLSYISKEDIVSAFDAIFKKDFVLENRALVRLVNPGDFFGGLDYALNEITIQKSDSSMITVNAFINDEFLNTYWTDGLIISTPTGSTAYSLSAGGPLVLPGSGTFVIAPIASHNLTVRPLVIPDNKIITLEVKSYSGNFLVTADNRTVLTSTTEKFIIKKADFSVRMLRLPNTNFYATLREKLMWGADKRN
jgi:NAD+ kinase